MVSKIKSAVITAAAVLAVIYVANRVPVTRGLVARALTAPSA
ncbi:MAG: hypothetical protein ACYCVW_17075 [Rhodocyclaceae bacterium]